MSNEKILTVYMLPSQVSPVLGTVCRDGDHAFTVHVPASGRCGKFARVIAHTDGFEIRRYDDKPSPDRYSTWREVAGALFGHGAHVEFAGDQS